MHRQIELIGPADIVAQTFAPRYLLAVRANRRAIELVVAFACGAALVVVIALIAGLWNGESTPVILNTDRVAHSIESSIRSQRHLASSVTCPVDIVQRQGVVFNCQAAVGTHEFSVLVTEVDSAGHVVYVVT